MPSAASTSVSHSRRCARQLQPGDRGVGRVGDVHRAAATASTRSTCRRCRSRDRGGASAIGELFEQPLQLRRRLVRAAAHALAAQRQARADRAQVLPADPGTDRFARRAVPHDGGTALVRDADRVDRSRVLERGGRELEARVGHRPRVELDDAVGRRLREQLALDEVRAPRRSASYTPTRTLLVPTSTTSTRSLLTGTHGQASSPNGLRRPSLPGFRMPFGSRASFTDCSTPNPAPSASATNRDRLRPTPW